MLIIYIYIFMDEHMGHLINNWEIGKFCVLLTNTLIFTSHEKCSCGSRNE